MKKHVLAAMLLFVNVPQINAGDQAEVREYSEKEEKEEAQYMIANAAQMLYKFGELVADPNNPENVQQALLSMAGSMFNIISYGMRRSPQNMGESCPHISIEMIASILALMVEPIVHDTEQLQKDICAAYASDGVEAIVV